MGGAEGEPTAANRSGPAAASPAPPGPSLLAAGDDAVLLEFGSAEEVEAAHRGLRAAALQGVVELVPAARTILVAYDPAVITPEAIAAGARPTATAATAPAAAASASVRIPVRYDGPDLEELSTLTGLAAAELVRRHTEPEYVVAFCGFAPGFAYLTGLDPVLRLPRRATPRTRVPAGSVAIADEFTGVYPAQSPGGWHLLGRTDAVLWDVLRDPPALLAPGTRVRFEAVAGAGAGAGAGAVAGEGDAGR